MICLTAWHFIRRSDHVARAWWCGIVWRCFCYVGILSDDGWGLGFCVMVDLCYNDSYKYLKGSTTYDNITRDRI
jgi:hypothetical protein